MQESPSSEIRRCPVGNSRHQGTHYHAAPDFWLCEEHNVQFEAAMAMTLNQASQKWREYIAKDGDPANPYEFWRWLAGLDHVCYGGPGGPIPI